MYCYTGIDWEVNQWRYMDLEDALQIFKIKIKSDKLLLLRKKEFQKKISMETKSQGQAITEIEKNFLNA